MAKTITDLGIDKITIDGTDLSSLCSSFEPMRQKLGALFGTANGGQIHFTPITKRGEPDEIDLWSFAFDYDLLSSTDKEFLEELQFAGGEHTLCYWKPIRITYTAYSGQTLLYLLRQNAPSALGESTTTYPMTFTVNGVARTVSFTADVTSGTAVPDGEVYVETAGLDMKTAPALAKDDVVLVTYYPLFRVVTQETRFSFPSPVSETKTFTFAEIR